MLDLAYVLRGGARSETWLSGQMGEGLGDGTIQPRRQPRAEPPAGTEVTPAALSPLSVPSCHAAPPGSLLPPACKMLSLRLLAPARCS